MVGCKKNNAMCSLWSSSKYLLYLRIDFGKLFCSIGYEYKGKEDQLDINLVRTLLLYVSRFFFICDDRQIDMMKIAISEILEHILERDQHKEKFSLTKSIIAKLYSILSEKELQAARSLFPLGLPTECREYRVEKKPIASYRFVVKKLGSSPPSTFHIGFDPNIVLLPISIGHVFHFLYQDIKDDDARLLMLICLKILVDSYHEVDCRSRQALHVLPDQILMQVLNHFSEEEDQDENPHPDPD